MGRPAGSENRGKRFRAAFNRLYEASPEKLDELALKAHTSAADGDMQAMSLIRDTMDGKPAQAIVGDDDADPISIRTIVTGVPRKADVEPGHD